MVGVSRDSPTRTSAAVSGAAAAGYPGMQPAPVPVAADGTFLPKNPPPHLAKGPSFAVAGAAAGGAATAPGVQHDIRFACHSNQHTFGFVSCVTYSNTQTQTHLCCKCVGS